LKPIQSGNTADSGHWEKRFKTEGDFGIRIIAKTKPAKYSIIVWNSKDITIDVPNAFKYKEGGTGGGGADFFKKYWMYILIGILLIAVIILLIKRKKQS